MSEQTFNDSLQAQQADAEGLTQSPATDSAGALLRKAREAAGVDVGALAQVLKVPVKKLEALEQDRYEQLPDAVFARALASSVCRALKIDPAPVLARLPQSAVPRLSHDDAGINTPFHPPGDMAKVPFWDRLSRPMVLAALTVLMGALVILLFPSHEQRAEIGTMVQRAVTGPAAPAPPMTGDSSGVALPLAAGPATMGTPSAQPPAAAASTAVVLQAAPASPAAVVETTQGAAGGEAAESSVETAGRKRLAPAGVLAFKTREPSWIEVVDAQGTVQLSRVVEPGESVGVTGVLPLAVVIGRADATDVQVRGKPLDLGPVTRQGVARFEVK